MKRLTSSNYFKERLLSKDFRDSFEDAHFFVDIAVQLHRSRVDAGLTQRQLADLSGLKQSNVARYESPGYQAYTLKVLLKIVRAMGGRLTLAIEKKRSTEERHSFNSGGRHRFVGMRAGLVHPNPWSEDSTRTLIDEDKIEANYSGVQYVQ